MTSGVFSKMPAKAFSFLFSVLLSLAVSTVSCSGQTEQQALESLRQMTRDGKLPAEDVVAQIESRFAGKRTGTLAKLLHARIRFENGDFAGAAAMLNSDVFLKQTKVADYALWLRGQALQKAGNDKEAMAVFEKLIADHPDSLRVRDARLLWADSATRSGDALKVPGHLSELIEDHDARALLAAAKAYESLNDQPNAVNFYRRTYFYGAGTNEAKEAEAKLTAIGESLDPKNAEEIHTRTEKLYAARNFAEAERSFTALVSAFPDAVDNGLRLKQIDALASLKKMADAQAAFNAIPVGAKEKERAYYELVTGYAAAKMWPEAHRAADEMRQAFPSGTLTPKAWVDAGIAAADSRNKGESQYFLGAALVNYPNAIEVAGAQFELAWLAHESGDLARSSQLLSEHLARYVDKDTTNRGRAGYWAARDSERAGKTLEACLLYDAVMYRYSANWYGYLALQRRSVMKAQGKCGENDRPPNELTAKAIANLKTVTVAPETSGPREMLRAERSDELSTIGLFDWAIDELNEAKRTAQNSPKINLALARHYRLKGDNVNALLALAKSYPDYAQMFPEEMGKEEWEIFYPLINWNDIKYWAGERKLDPYQVAGLIRQESVFNPRARSGANAYGLMQLLVPTAQTMARKYVSKTSQITSETLFQPPLNIELGTAFMRDQLDKFGRIEYMAVAYNAGPGRVPQWRASLPAEIDEFVEEIPFRETKGYVQGVIRNSAQYRRLYDENGNFRSNVGTRPLRGEIDTKPRDQFLAENPDIKLDDPPSSE